MVYRCLDGDSFAGFLRTWGRSASVSARLLSGMLVSFKSGCFCLLFFFPKGICALFFVSLEVSKVADMN